MIFSKSRFSSCAHKLLSPRTRPPHPSHLRLPKQRLAGRREGTEEAERKGEEQRREGVTGLQQRQSVSTKAWAWEGCFSASAQASSHDTWAWQMSCSHFRAAARR